MLLNHPFYLWIRLLEDKYISNIEKEYISLFY